MKILFGMPASDSWGGPVACEPPFVAALEKLGVQVETETYVYGDKERETPLLSRFFRVIKTALRFRRRLAAERFDIVHLNTAFDKKTLLRDSLSLLLFGRHSKILLKIHGSSAQMIPANSFYGRLVKFLDRRVAGYGVFTQEELDAFLPHGIDPQKLHIVKNVVELDKRAESRKHKEPTDDFELLFVSRFVETKGLLETIRATEIVLDQGKNVTLNCVGDGPVKKDAETLVTELGINDRVHFTGYVPEKEVDKFLISSDIFIFPTRHNEGFPIALFKAALASLPIVTTPVRAAAEYFEDGVNCLFCSTDPQDVAEKIAQLINDRSLREKMSEANAKLRAMLTPENVAEEYLAIYEKILSDK